MSNRAKCVILVPANYGIEPECERALGQLERLGVSDLACTGVCGRRSVPESDGDRRARPRLRGADVDRCGYGVRAGKR